MKTIRKILISILSVLMLFTFSMAIACDKPDPEPSGYTVTFMVEGEQYGSTQTVQRGRRVEKPADPTFTTEGYVFTGWYIAQTFEDEFLWNFQTGIVTDNLTLYAGYRVVNAYVQEVAKAEEPVTSKLTWTQASASDASDYEVIITNDQGVPTTLTGTVSFDAQNFKVTFTPATIPQGGVYTVSVKDTTKTQDACVVEGVIFNGAGTQSNPYLVANALDFTAVNQANVQEGTHFSLAKSISILTNRDNQKGFVFNGILIGNGRTITVSGNSGAIYKVGETGLVKQVSVAGALSTALYDSVGAMVDYNAGRVEKINVTANVESTAGMVGTSGIENALNESLADGAGSRGIAGGIVGTNLATGVVYNSKITTTSSSTGTIKARIGGGTIVGYNKGTVELCTSEGCFGAWNSKETGKSTSNYSYSGGIVGINAGTITKCAVKGSGKILGQRIENEGSIVAGTNNANLGGIVGYNMAGASVNESYFTGIRVHGDENVGGIVGLNAGAISNCYVAGAYNDTTKIYTYVGGRTNIGGIAGKVEEGSVIKNSFVTANVYAYGTSGIAYAVAESANNVVYLSANLNAKSKDDTKTNPDPATLVAPSGTNNVVVEVTAGSGDGANTDYALTENYLTAINGEDKFFFEDTIKLNFIKDVLPEETMQVVLYNDEGAIIEEVAVAETGAPVAGPAKRGFVFAGWATTLGGEIAFAKGAAISMYDLIDFKGSDGKAKLYAVMEERVPNEGLIVAVWSRYIDQINSDAIKESFESYLATLTKTYNVEFRAYAENAVADFCAAVNEDGDIDVIIGAGNTVNANNGIDYIARANMVTEGFTDRKAALLTDTERATEFYAFVTGLQAGSATITFDVKGTQTSGTVDAILGDTVNAPEVTAESGFELIGWATTENATEALITKSKVGYSDVKDILVEGAVILYPVFEAVTPEVPEQDTSLKISVWTNGGTWVTEDELNAVKSGFESYLAGQGIDVATLTITYVETTTAGNKVAELGAVVNEAGDFDFIIGCGANVTTKGGVATKEKVEMNTSVFAAGRYVARLTDNTLAVHLYNYFTSLNA